MPVFLITLGQFLISNGPELFQAGANIVALWQRYGQLASAAAKTPNNDITAADFHAFMDQVTSVAPNVDTIIARARAEVAAQTAAQAPPPLAPPPGPAPGGVTNPAAPA